MRRSEPKLSQFGPAFAWLLEKEVSSSRLASLFQTTPENIRLIAFRWKSGGTPPASSSKEFQLNDDPEPELADSLGIRPSPDEVVRTPAGKRKLDWLTSAIESTAAQHIQQYTYLEGHRALRGLLPQIGYASDARRIALSARLHQHAAWFLVHAGQCFSATEEARKAQDLWRRAYHESRYKEYAERFIQSALIGSNAWLLARRPDEALQTLELARSAAESIGAPRGSDHFRQRGVALFQRFDDDNARAAFRESAEAMERLNEATTPAQISMSGSRYTNLLGSLNWDGAAEVLALARRDFGPQSLEVSMALHWAVACGVSTDSSPAIQEATDLITAEPLPAPQFGHQLTIRKLLAITPELGFDARLRRFWARRTLYENAFRNR